MENKAFQVRYKDSQIEINTHFNTERTALRLLPLQTVADLISDYFPNAAPYELVQYSLHLPDGTAIHGNTLLTALYQQFGSYKQLLIIKSRNSRRNTVGISDFLSNSLGDIPKDLAKPFTAGTKRNYPKTPSYIGRWEGFKSEAASYEYPTTPIGTDVFLPATTEIKFQLERDVAKVVGNHLDNFNRIFRDQGMACRFRSKADVFPSTPETEPTEYPLCFIGQPDKVLTVGSKVLSFVEYKTPNDLPVRHHQSGNLFDLLEMYKEDMQWRARGDIGRKDVRAVIDQVYGYLLLNNLIYGCVTCYDVTYFLWQPEQGTLLISHPIFNHSNGPGLLQAFYYFVQLVLHGHHKKQKTTNITP